MSEKYEDGIWCGRYGNGEGDFGVRYLVKERAFSRRFPDGTYGGLSCSFLPINRIADLDGRPVVDERVIEELAGWIHVGAMVMESPPSTDEIKAVLLSRLAPQPQQANDEIAALKARIAELEQQRTNVYREVATGDEWLFLPEANGGNRWGLRLRDSRATWVVGSLFSTDFTPADPPTTEGDVLTSRLRGFNAFLCWTKTGGEERVAWECPGFPGWHSVLMADGRAHQYNRAEFEKAFTRTPPVPLSPEHERLVGPIAAYFKVDESEARKALATCAGG